jgi:hypothetical protein
VIDEGKSAPSTVNQQSTTKSATSFKPSLQADLAKTLGFCLGQRTGLQLVGERFPKLAHKTTLGRLNWGAVFKDAEANVEARLKSLYGKDWPETRAKMIAEFDSMTRQQDQNLTADSANEFLDLVQERAKGNIESPIREVLLASHPSFIKSPEVEFARGFTNTYSSKGHSKSTGVEVTLKYPVSWIRQEGDRPHIVQKWTSDAGHGSDILMLQIHRLPAVPTKAELADMFTEDFAKEMIPDNGKLIRFATGKLEGLPLGILHYTATSKRLNATVEIRTVSYHFVWGANWILLQLGCSTPGGPDVREKRLTQLEPLMKLIANSVVLPEKY